MGIDPTATTVTLLDPETGKGRVTYLCEGQPTRLFQPTPGLWFSNQSDEVFVALQAEYERDPYPSDADLERIAQKVNAPGVAQVKTFFENMRLKEMNGL